MSNIGMMNPAYAVGRVELLNWLNDLLKLDYTKVEQTCSAAAHCQIMDAIYPGVPLSKVNFNAKHEYEYVKNFKVLQSIFDKNGIDKYIDVTKLIKGKYQDNLEFLQWMKAFYELHATGAEYDAVERRRQAGIVLSKDSSVAKKTSTSKEAVTNKENTNPPANKRSASDSIATATSHAPASRTTKPAARVAVPAASASKATTVAKAKTETPKADPQMEKKIQELQHTIAELKLTVDGLEKERDFYFGKLREIELLVQAEETQDTINKKSIQDILYATEESAGVAAADGDDEVY